jgi:N-acyl-D-amino-acid deacylase
LPAARFRLAQRGLVAPGYCADLVVFDPDRVADSATFARPKVPAAGVVSVYVNGTEVWREGSSTGALPGQVVRRAA